MLIGRGQFKKKKKKGLQCFQGETFRQSISGREWGNLMQFHDLRSGACWVDGKTVSHADLRDGKGNAGQIESGG